MRHGRKAFDEMQRLLAPVGARLRGIRDLRDICDLLGQRRLALVGAWEEKLAADARARAQWQALEDTLLHLVNVISSRELQRPWKKPNPCPIPRNISSGASFSSPWGCWPSCWSCSCCCGVTCCGRWCASPATFPASRDGMQPEPIPAVRITELREVVDIMPDLGGYLVPQGTQLPAGTGEGRLPRMSFMDSLTGIAKSACS